MAGTIATFDCNSETIPKTTYRHPGISTTSSISCHSGYTL